MKKLFYALAIMGIFIFPVFADNGLCTPTNQTSCEAIPSCKWESSLEPNFCDDCNTAPSQNATYTTGCDWKCNYSFEKQDSSCVACTNLPTTGVTGATYTGDGANCDWQAHLSVGYYWTGSVTDTCPKGSMCPGGSAITNSSSETGRTQCTPGTYQDQTGQSSCESCPSAGVDNGTNVSSSSSYDDITSCYTICTPPNTGGTTHILSVSPSSSYHNLYSTTSSPAGYPTCSFTVTCNTSFFPSCSQCPDPSCDSCSEGTYYDNASSSCKNCPYGGQLPTGSHNKSDCYMSGKICGNNGCVDLGTNPLSLHSTTP